MRVRHKPWALPYLNQSECALVYNSEAPFVFDVKHDHIWLEVGVGKGAFFVEMAEQHRDIYFVGIELNSNIAAVALQKIIAANLRNVLLIVGNALEVLPHIPEATFARIILNHSDPWPKKRHAKRRLSAPSFLHEYHRVLKDRGIIVFKTDNDDFADFTAEMLSLNSFKVERFDKDYDGTLKFDTITEYEQNFRNAGITINLIKAVKE